MALTLVEAAKLSETKLQRGVVETFVLESVVLDRIPLLDIEGNAYAYNEEGTLPGVEFRAVNAAYSESTGTVNQKTETLVILGGDADVDTFIQKTRSDLNDQRAVQDRMKVKAATIKFQDTLINGDVAVDANSFDGLKKRLTGAQVIDAATDGIDIVGADSAARQLFFDQLDQLIARATYGGRQPDALYANDLLIAKILSAMRRENAHIDRVGDKQSPTYNGIPILDIGTKADGTRILPQTETQGAGGAAHSSIYAVRFGQDESDAGVTGLTNGGVDVRDLGELESKPAFRTRIEFFTGLALFGGRAAARLRGLRAA